jgi:hypothetical protein
MAQLFFVIRLAVVAMPDQEAFAVLELLELIFLVH